MHCAYLSMVSRFVGLIKYVKYIIITVRTNIRFFRFFFMRVGFEMSAAVTGHFLMCYCSLIMSAILFTTTVPLCKFCAISISPSLPFHFFSLYRVGQLVILPCEISVQSPVYASTVNSVHRYRDWCIIGCL